MIPFPPSRTSAGAAPSSAPVTASPPSPPPPASSPASPTGAATQARNASRPWRRLLPRTRRGKLILAAAFILVPLLFAWLLARATPPWYAPLNPSDTAVIDNFDRAKNLLWWELNNTVQRVPLGEQKWSISQNEMNSYLAIQFAPPQNADGSRTAPAAPPVISDPIALFSPGCVTICARTTRLPGSDPRGGVATAVFSVQIIPGDHGTALGLVQLKSTWIGMMPIPRSLVLSRLESLLPALLDAVRMQVELRFDARKAAEYTPRAQEIARALIEGKPFALRYTIDRKDILIKDLGMDEGRFTIDLVPPTPATVLPRPMR